jgi:hypothetical protein
MRRAKPLGGRRRWSARDAQAQLAAWRASAQSLQRYCRAQGLGYERLRRWRRKLERASDPAGLRPVRIVGAPGTAHDDTTLVVELPCGRRMNGDGLQIL